MCVCRLYKKTGDACEKLRVCEHELVLLVPLHFSSFILDNVVVVVVAMVFVFVGIVLVVVL